MTKEHKRLMVPLVMVSTVIWTTLICAFDLNEMKWLIAVIFPFVTLLLYVVAMLILSAWQTIGKPSPEEGRE